MQSRTNDAIVWLEKACGAEPQLPSAHAWLASAALSPNTGGTVDLTIFPASRENTGNFAYFACWEQPKGAEYRRDNSAYERIPGALEQGNFGSHQGIELGNQVLSGKELSLALFGICAKRK